MNKQRRKEIDRIADELRNIHSLLEDLQNEEQEYLDNMPENMQQGDRGQQAEEAISALEDAVSSIDEAISRLEDAQQ